MAFSSTVFLFVFLPALLLIYYCKLVKSNKTRNIILLIASLLFYAYGEPIYILVMLVSILINYTMGLLINKCKEENKNAKIVLIIGIILNIGILIIFKYLNFILENLTLLTNKDLTIESITLPLGISFYTFSILSYLIDVYKGEIKTNEGLLNIALYITFFPKISQGPIIKYSQMQEEINNRKYVQKDFTEGVIRFIIGLAKKVIIANYIALIADNCFMVGSMSTATAWLGAISYTLQIYFDFSGYSDMAIGIGKMFGFNLLENFDYPYSAGSITEFWRKWHITLGLWFRNYVYIPLGGSRVKKPRLIFNLLVVWLLTGIWHGANWNFVIWGLIYFVLLAIEKLTNLHKNKKFTKTIGHIYTLFFVIIGWVFFRSDSIESAIKYLTEMFTIGKKGIIDVTFIEYLKQAWFVLTVGIIASFPVTKAIQKIIEKKKINKTIINIVKSVGLCAIFILSLSMCISSTYSPFIYFNF